VTLFFVTFGVNVCHGKNFVYSSSFVARDGSSAKSSSFLKLEQIAFFHTTSFSLQKNYSISSP